jgi:hypothetical protein
MADKDFVKLDPAKMGFHYLGSVPEADQGVLQRAFDTLKADMGKALDEHVKAGEIFWMNVWQDDTDDNMQLSDKKLAKGLDAFAKACVKRYCEKGAVLDGYGFIVNPIGSKTQNWHVDYTTDAAAVWIPLTQFTDKNATQFVLLPEDTPDAVLEGIAANVYDVDLDKVIAGVGHLKIEQIAAKPMSVLYMGRGTLHRGITNTGPDHRGAFYVSVHFIEDYDANYPYPMEERPEPSVVEFNTLEFGRAKA